MSFNHFGFFYHILPLVAVCCIVIFLSVAELAFEYGYMDEDGFTVLSIEIYHENTALQSPNKV